MQIEIGENLSWTLMIVGVASALAFGATKGCQIVYENDEKVKTKAFEAGLVEKVGEGRIGAIWTKPETK
jgi:hypothetical protein